VFCGRVAVRAVPLMVGPAEPSAPPVLKLPELGKFAIVVSM
jgi:hypothetical protein